ncbi:MAG: hypothetical protein JWM85_1098 [Acidimicrobiaceae bacterium]|nr:hypothetical protein [Acidimicrobiaceae bacterium]
MIETRDAGATGADLRSTGERIDRLLEASDSAGPAARQRAEELVRLVTDLYGAGLERLLEILSEREVLTDEVLGGFASDELVSALLLVHGLHPFPVEERVARALEEVRPYLGSHGGDVELIEVTDDGVVRLKMLGSCQGCPSSSVTLELAVEDAIASAAPEVTVVEVAKAPESKAGVAIPLAAPTVRARTPSVGDVTWLTVATAGEVPTGRLLAVSARDLDLVLCRVGATAYAYRDACPACGASLAGSAIERLLGGASGAAVLTCASCHRHFDLRHAGAGLDDAAEHLVPVPLLERAGAITVALSVSAPASGVPA